MTMEDPRGVPWRTDADPQAPAPDTPPTSAGGSSTPGPGATEGATDPSCGCASCGERRPQTQQEEYVYALGKLDVRFPSVGLEREFRQRSARVSEDATAPRGARLRQVLEGNGHLARRMCYLLLVGGTPAYVVAPTASHMYPEVMSAVERIGQDDSWALVIGRRGPITSPGSCGGVIAPIVACDQLYAFSRDEWYGSLEAQLEPAFTAKRLVRKDFGSLARELFGQVVESTENLGASDAHRAVNYLLMQHPGLFLAAAERAGKQRLDRIETRSIFGLGLRRLVGVVATFIDPVTGVAERLFTRVDVTEEWPFVADTAEGTPAPLGLLPYVDNALLGAMA
jgi:PatG Domain